MVAPTIVIIPGLWLGPRPYELLVEEMKKAAPSLTDFVYAPLVSTGKASPGNPTMHDDAMGIREVIKPLVQAGKRLVLVGHSAGAFLSGMATEDLEVGEKLAVASGGGVERFIFIAGGILPPGAPHPELNFYRIEVSSPEQSYIPVDSRARELTIS
jgi:pimeloyl-ACP methyl ester carboxylesterase